MHRKHIPSMGPRYWVALSIVSVFGANLGDFSARYLHLGHALGLAPMAVLLGLIFLAERRDRNWNQAYYWLAIIVIRAAATNFGDLISSDFKLPRPWGMLILAVLLALTLFVGRPRPAEPAAKSADELPPTDARYWIAMMIAGTLGTVTGDFTSRTLGGTGKASLALGAMLAVLLFFGSRGLLAKTAYYWLTIVAVRSAGTSFGDFVAGRQFLNLGIAVSTLCTGLIFVAVVVLWKDKASRKSREVAG